MLTKVISDIQSPKKHGLHLGIKIVLPDSLENALETQKQLIFQYI